MKQLFKHANKRISLGGAAALLIVVALLGQMLGFLRNRLIGANFTQPDPLSSDAFFAAFQIPDFFFFTIAAGALGVAFMPILSDRLQKGDKQGVWMLTSSLMTVLAGVMAVVAVVVFIFAEPLIRLITPNLEGRYLDDAVMIMRLIAINPLLFTLSGILTSVQQIFGRFFFFAIAPLSYNLCIIASIYLFKDSLGIVGLGVGALVGGFVQLFVASLGLIGLGFRYRPQIAWRNPHFKDVLRQLPPRSIDQGIDSINSIVETNRANFLSAGSISHYNFALTLHNVPISLIGTTISTAAFPRLTERLSQGRPDLFRSDFLKILRTMIWITAPVIVVSYFGRGYLARLLFGDVAPEVALIFGYLTAAMFFRIIYSIVSRYFYAQKDTKTPLIVSIFAIALNIYLAFKLARPEAAGGYDIAGLAMAQSTVAAAEVAILFSIMLLRDHKLFDINFWGGCIKILSVTGFSILTCFMMVSLLPLKLADVGLVTLGGKFAAIAAATILVHAAISALFGLEEVRPVWKKFRQMIMRPVRIQ